MENAARRAFLGSVLAGGLVAGGALPASAATWTPRSLPTKKLKTGDLILGPNSTLVRVASRRKLPNGRQQIRYTHPNTGEPTPMTPALDGTGYPGRLKFVVLQRDVAVKSVLLTPIPDPTDPNVIDGGRP